MYSMCKYLRILDFCQTSWVTTSHATAGFHPKGPFDSCSCSKQQAAGKLRCQHISGVGVNLFCLLLGVVLLHILHGQQGNASSTNLSSYVKCMGKEAPWGIHYPPHHPYRGSRVTSPPTACKAKSASTSSAISQSCISWAIKNHHGDPCDPWYPKQKTWPVVATICKIYIGT